LYNVHFWLGAECTQDEQGTAAYKTVELDDLLGDLPVQFRECEGEESKEFLACFDNKIKILKGGIESGFNNIKPDQYQPRLTHIKGKQQIRVVEVKLHYSSLNHGDVFILDGGLDLFQWNGKSAGIFEKRKANEIIQGLKKDRNGRPRSVVLDNLEDNDTFWKLLGGKPRDDQIQAATSDDIKAPVHEKKLFRLSDSSGEMKMTPVQAAAGGYQKSQLDPADVFILDTGNIVYSWIGSGATKNERAAGIKSATDYLRSHGRPMNTQVSRVLQGKELPAFLREFR